MLLSYLCLHSDRLCYNVVLQHMLKVQAELDSGDADKVVLNTLCAVLDNCDNQHAQALCEAFVLDGILDAAHGSRRSKNGTTVTLRYIWLLKALTEQSKYSSELNFILRRSQDSWIGWVTSFVKIASQEQQICTDLMDWLNSIKEATIVHVIS